MTTSHIRSPIATTLGKIHALSDVWNCTKNSARKPAERTGIRGGEEGLPQRRLASRVKSTGAILCVIMREKPKK